MNKILLTSISILFFFLGNTQSKNFIDQPYIEVTGSADSLITPNEIFIRINISEKDTKDRISVEESEAAMIKSFKALGLNIEADLTTRDMLSNYQNYFLRHKEIIKSKEYILKVTNAMMASKVFIELENLGISNVSIDHVDHSEMENIKNACRTRAIENAKSKALALTRPIGQTVGPALLISDNEARLENQLQGRIAGLMIKNYSGANKEREEVPDIEFEKIKVEQAISIKFMLK